MEPRRRRNAGDTKSQRIGDTPTQYRILTVPAGSNYSMSGCSDCGLEVDHCHGTLVVHDDRTVDCTEAACELPDLLRHAFIVDCVAVLGGCCAVEKPAEFAVAS